MQSAMSWRHNADVETLLITDAGGVRTITLNRPDSLNAVTEQMTTELQSALKDVLKTKTVRCIVLTGAGRAFCAGQDVKSLREQSDRGTPMDFAADLRRRYNPVILRLRSLEIPVVAAINGVAAGAGWSLALAADIRIASDKASFVAAFSKIGLIPDSGMTWMLPRLVGLSRALEIAWLSDPVTPDRALGMGLVNQVVPHETLMDETNKIAARLAAGATRGFGFTKRAMNAAYANDLEPQLEYEAQLQAAASQTRDHHEGVQAFLNRREAQFQGE